ncbi:hypothetical protein PR048_013069 [Dryococelus australis]|uniref:DDE Tnp4 domain-containing protein n=1 Tax=Dryococelus australis TaxID=614101 RepID=A0ABQ9HR72_9NEOP|nr:hypothetical protein PR048_013069 [Dryococelus australis]
MRRARCMHAASKAKKKGCVLQRRAMASGVEAATTPVMEKLLCLFTFNIFLCQNRKIRYWTHPIVSSRLLKGAFVTLIGELRENEYNFLNYFRMSIQSFDELLCKLETTIKGKDTNIRMCIRPLEIYLGSSRTFADLNYQYRMGKTTLALVINKVCKAVWKVLRKECVPPLTKERWLENSRVFETLANFPNCLGALNGKHIRIITPQFGGSQSFNYKMINSVVLFLIADANDLFNYFEVGSYGKESDNRIFKNSKQYKLVESGQANIPNARPLLGTTESTMPFTFIGDEAFSLSNSVFRPHTGTFISHNKRVLNYRLCRARRYVECAFGILTNNGV